MVHGDDFVSVGDRQAMKLLREELEARFEVKSNVIGNGLVITGEANSYFSSDQHLCIEDEICVAMHSKGHFRDMLSLHFSIDTRTETRFLQNT